MAGRSGALKSIVRRTVDRRLLSESRTEGMAESVSGESQSRDGQAVDVEAAGKTASLDQTQTAARMQPEMPEHPERPAIWRMPSRKPLVKIVRRIFGKRELTDEERAERSEMEARKAMEKQLRAEANLFMDRIINQLNILELCYRYPKSERDLLNSGVTSVRFSHVVMQPEAIYLRIDTVHLPRGVNVLRLIDDEILTNLALACGHKITSEYNVEIGAWYIVERATGVRGIPIHVKYQDMISAFPASADELTIPLGMGQNSKKIYRSLKEMPHLLIAGATDSGKSNAVNVIIGTLISRNSPENLRLLLVDLKGGMEFGFFEGVPHLLAIPELSSNGIIYGRENVPDVLEWLIREGERRMELLKNAGHKNVTRYNTNRKKGRLYRIVLVIDEWADVRLVKTVGSRAEDGLSNLASRMRAVGIHVIVATQSPKKEVISTIIKTNLPAKIAFSCPSYTSSELILDNGDAKGLAPQGRCIWQKGSEQLTLQTPYMPDGLIREIVDNAREGRNLQITTTHDVTLDEVLEFALDQLAGELSIKRLFEHFRERGLTRAELQQWMSEIEGQRISIRENEYSVSIQSGSAPRKLILAVGGEVEKQG